MPARQPKISEALLAFARPLFEHLPDGAGPDEMAPLLRIAALVWNAVAAEKLGHDNPYLDQAREVIRKNTSGLQRDLGLAMLADMEARKRSEYPPDLRMIGDFRFIEREGGVLNLQVDCHAAKPPPKAERNPGKTASPAQGTQPAGSHTNWRALYSAAEEFRQRAPWEWMGDLDIFGVQDPATGVIGWCVVLGSGGEFFGLSVHLGDRGFDQIRRMHSHLDEVSEEAAFGLDAMVFSLLSRDEVDAKQLKRIRALGLRPRGRNAWPVFESHAPGRLPLPLAENEVGFMQAAILQALEVSSRLLDDPECLILGHEDRLLVRASQDGGGSWTDTWIPEPDPPAPAPQPHFDQVAARRSHADLRRIQAVVECDIFPMEAIIQGEDRPPYAPAAFMVADSKTGFVLHVQLGHPSERLDLARRELLAAFQKHGAVPATVVVCRPEIEDALAPLASSLGFELKLADKLPMVEEARTAFQDHLSGPPRKTKKKGSRKPRKRR